MNQVYPSYPVYLNGLDRLIYTWSIVCSTQILTIFSYLNRSLLCQFSILETKVLLN